MRSLATTFTLELGSLKQTLSAQAAEHSALTSALIERFAAQITTLQTRMEAQASEYESFKSTLWSLMSQKYAALQASFSDQLTDLKMTHTVQHDDLVGVRAALHAVCAQMEAFKAMPAAVAKHIQGLRLHPARVVEIVAPKLVSSADAKGQSRAHKV